jgi:peptide chain release factor subunit 3
MSNLNSWEDDPAAQDENLAQQAQQQLNVNPAAAQGSFRPGGASFTPGAASFQPGAASFQPGQAFGGGYAQQYQQPQYYQQQQGFYPQYSAGQGQGFDQYNQQQQYQNYGGGFNQGYNQNLSMLKSAVPAYFDQ